MTTPAFLAALGLDIDADERAVRRAYAQRLKAIDQETEPAAFQALHEAFEAATRWAKNRPKSASDPAAAPAPAAIEPPLPATAPVELPSAEPVKPFADERPKPPADPLPRRIPEDRIYSRPAAAPAPAPPPRPVPPDQEAIGAAVFKEFAERFAQNAQEGRFNAGSLRKVLELTLNDPRLLNLQASAAFERRVAELVANGWQPGHELLLDAAAEIFHWMDDKQRLDGMGDLGTFLNRALTEQASFLNTGGTALKLRLRLIERLRDSQAPSEQEVSSNLKNIEMMYARYPNWLRLVTNLQNINLWRQGAQNLATEIQQIKKKTKLEERKEAAIGVVVVIAVIFAWGMLVRSGDKPPQYRNDTYRQTFQDQTTASPDTVQLPSMPKAAPLPQLFPTPYDDKQIRQTVIRIRSNLHFPRPDQPVGNNPVTYAVNVGADGMILSVRKQTNSALPAFDEELLKAIYRSQPLPKSTDQVSASSFVLRATPQDGLGGANQ